MLRALLYCCAQWFEWWPMTGLASDEMIEGNGTRLWCLLPYGEEALSVWRLHPADRNVVYE